MVSKGNKSMDSVKGTALYCIADDGGEPVLHDLQAIQRDI